MIRNGDIGIPYLKFVKDIASRQSNFYNAKSQKLANVPKHEQFINKFNHNFWFAIQTKIA